MTDPELLLAARRLLVRVVDQGANVVPDVALTQDILAWWAQHSEAHPEAAVRGSKGGALMETAELSLDVLEEMERLAAKAGADFYLPYRLSSTPNGGVLLQIGNQPGATVTVATPNGQPPFQIGWM